MIFVKTTYQGHIGRPITPVCLVQADGDELSRCCDILGIPVPKEAVVKFDPEQSAIIVEAWNKIYAKE